MNKKLSIVSLLVFTSIVSFGFFSFASGDVSGAVAYLKTKDPNPWITMALVASGESPNVDYLKTVSGNKAADFEAPILALSAAGKNPRTFGSENLVSKLKSFYIDNQIGDPALVNDDIFGLLALVASGEPLSDPVIEGAKDFILNHQNSDGSWSYGLGANGDTNMTSMAIMALSDVGIAKTNPEITKALDYLRSAQNSDGGFPYDPKSEWNTDSDSSSDTWVISALNKLGENPGDWKKDGQSPVDHLNSLADASGFYKFQANSSEDSFSPVTTSYAVIALTGKFYPVAKFTPPASPSVSYRIEGKNKNVCSGETNAPNALELIKIVATDCGFTYHIKEMSFGPYLESINSDVAEGLTGWLYNVNFLSPTVGAADYNLSSGDYVLWYYGEYDWLPTRLILSQSEIASGGSSEATVKHFSSGAWLPLEGATVYFGLHSFTTNSSGQVSATLQDGAYQVFAEKNDYIRSEVEKLIVGEKTQTTLTLSANIMGGPGGSDNPGGETVGFTITTADGDSNLGFGDIAPGASKSENLTLKNQGQKKLYLEGSVKGDEAFTRYLDIDSKDWEDFNMELESGKNSAVSVELKIPVSFSASGQKNGQLIFWAIPIND